MEMTLSERITKVVADLADERRESILSNPYQFEVRQFVYVVGYDYNVGQAYIKKIIVEDLKIGGSVERQVKYVFNKKPNKRAEKEYVINHSGRTQTPEMPFVFATSKEAYEMAARIKQGIKNLPL